MTKCENKHCNFQSVGGYCKLDEPCSERALSDSAPATGSVSKLEASIAAIHYHSGRGFEDKIEAIAVLKSIHEECEFAMPILKTIKVQNVTDESRFDKGE